MARQSAHRLVVLFGVFGGLTTLSTPQLVRAGEMESGRPEDVLFGLSSSLPSTSDYQNGLFSSVNEMSAQKARDAAPRSGVTESGSAWAKAASPAPNARAAALSPHSGVRGADIPESIEALQPIEEGYTSALLPDPDAVDLTGCDLTDRLCISSGSANHGRLSNGVMFPAIPGVNLRSSDAYGTPETIAGLRYSVAKVRQLFPEGTPDLVLGDISRNGGGHLNPHVSHQSGRDVDVGFYHTTGTRDFAVATAANLDVARTWAFIEALLEDHKVEYIFIDSSVQRLLYNYVKYDLGAPEGYLEQVFAYRGSRNAVIRHASGHRNHLHVRFWSPIAVAAATGLDLRPTGADGWDFLALDNFKRGSYVARDAFERVEWGPAPKLETIKTWKTVMVSYRVKPGDNLGKIARAHGVDTSTLRRWNGLKSDHLRAGQSLKIEQKRRVEVEVPVQVAVAQAALPAAAAARDTYQGDDAAPELLPPASQWRVDDELPEQELAEGAEDDSGEGLTAALDAEPSVSGNAESESTGMLNPSLGASERASVRMVAEPVSLASAVMPLAMDPMGNFALSSNRTSAGPASSPVSSAKAVDSFVGSRGEPTPVALARVTSPAPAVAPSGTAPLPSDTVATLTSTSPHDPASTETELDMMYVSLDEVGEGFRRVDGGAAAADQRSAATATAASMALHDAPTPGVQVSASTRASGEVVAALSAPTVGSETTPSEQAVASVASAAPSRTEPVASPSRAVENARAAIAQSLSANRFKTVQRVQQARVGQGDNLWRIAHAHGVSVDSLLKLNPSLSRNSTLKPGQQLTVKVWEERIPVEAANASNDGAPQGRLPFGG